MARLESGRAADPRFRTVERLVRAAGGELRFDVGRNDGGRCGGLADVPHEELRDRAHRHYPAHLDVWEVREPKDWPGAWWAEWYTLPPEKWPLPLPPATYQLSRKRRNRRRACQRVRDSVTVRRVTGAALSATSWRFVAEMPGGELIGELRAHERSPHLDWGGPERPGEREVVLDGVLVAAEHRGLGIGRRLVEALAAETFRAGVNAIHAVAQFGGIRLLLACGFTLQASRPAALWLERPISAGPAAR